MYKTNVFRYFKAQIEGVAGDSRKTTNINMIVYFPGGYLIETGYF
jgi:hypothetical protein